MDRRSAKYLAAIIAVLALLTPASAFADQKSGSQPTAPTLDNNAFKAAMDKFREDQKTVRTLKKFHWSRLESGILIVDVAANAFCYSMVRNLVGAAVAVGEGRFEKEWAQAILDNKERVSDSYVFPANGLTLVKVTY